MKKKKWQSFIRLVAYPYHAAWNHLQESPDNRWRNARTIESANHILDWEATPHFWVLQTEE